MAIERYTINNIPASLPWADESPAARTLQNAKNLLMIRRGEIPYERDRGLSTWIWDTPLSYVRQQLPREIDRLMLWEPDVSVRKVRCYQGTDGELVIEVDVEIDIDES